MRRQPAVSHAKLFRCAGLTWWRLAAQETFEGGARAQKRLEIVLEQNRRGSTRSFRKSRCGGPTLQEGSTCAACESCVSGVGQKA